MRSRLEMPPLSCGEKAKGVLHLRLFQTKQARSNSMMSERVIMMCEYHDEDTDRRS